MRAAILVPAADFPEEWDWAYGVEAAALRGGGFMVKPVPWPEGGSVEADVILPLVAWGYHEQPERWFALLDRLEATGARVINPVAVLRWNSDKRYLEELAEQGVPTIPTRAVAALGRDDLDRAIADWGDVVVKPAVSAAAHGTHRVGQGQDVPADALGRPRLLQPFCRSVVAEGEYSLVFLGGVFSHALVKRPKAGDYRVQPHLGGIEEACAPPQGAIAVAEAALAAAPEPPAYARVDLLRGNDGALKVIELELVEPSLWLDLAPGSDARFAAAIRAALE